MKIFWSWQSDTPGKIGRHFVRDAIQEAIGKLREDAELDEPERDSDDASREDLHLDHDRKGVAGSPDLANTILAKIRESSVFIADVTPVGKTPNKKKAILNPNVGIELGYALAQIGDNGLLMILNRFYGDRDTLPFDLKHKAGPIMYNLGPSATREEITEERQFLVGDLKAAIRDCIVAARQNVANASAKHIPIKCKDNCSVYFDYNESLDERQIEDRQVAIAYSRRPLLYLRLIPANRAPDLKRNAAKEIAYGIKIQPLRQFVGGGASWGLNQYGAITYSFRVESEGADLLTSSQVLLNREIWGLDATLLSGDRLFPSVAFEELYETGLSHYLQVAQNLLQLMPPLYIEAGASGVADFRMGMNGRYVGRVFGDEIKSRKRLQSFDAEEVKRVLLAIFEDFFDAFGEKRPKNFRGFPQSDS